jgi:hypothetical protein
LHVGCGSPQTAAVKESGCMRDVRRILWLLVVLLSCTTPVWAQQDSADETSIVTGSLEELRNRRRVLLLVQRSNVIDSRGSAKTVLNEAYKSGRDARLRYPRVYNLIAQKLNKYMQKYQSISAAIDVSDADFIIFFNLLEYRRPLGYPHAYGEMFVILNDKSSGGQPRIIWKTRKNSVWVEDAIGDLIRDLRAARGES